MDVTTQPTPDSQMEFLQTTRVLPGITTLASGGPDILIYKEKHSKAMTKSLEDPVAGSPRFEAQLHRSLALWPWTCFLNSLWLSVLLCKRGLIISLLQRVGVWIKQVSIWETEW